jgi:membrane protein insertase Oxa1/YidC/SpoIIIJ
MQRGGAYFKYLLINTRIEKGEHMSYCPKCGNKVEENMTFCPRCGAPLKAEAPVQAAPAPAPQRGEKAEKGEKQEKHEKQEPEKGEKHEKGEYGFIGWLIGGVVLILIGFFALLQFAGYLTSGMGWAFVLLVVGVVIIIAAVYLTTMARRRYPTT